MRKLIITTATAIAVAISMVGATAPALAAGDPKGIPGAAADAPEPPINPTKPKGVAGPKGLPGAPVADSLTSCTGVCYKYSTGRQILGPTELADGASIRATVSNPYLADVQQGDIHTLVELSVQNVDPVSGNRNIVEIGWMKDNGGINPNNDDPFLFVFSWVNGVAGTYNGGNGYAHAVGCSPCAGDSLSGDINTAKTFEWQHIGTAWWAKYNGNYVGAFPDATWGGTFTKAQTVQTFGEIAATHSNNASDIADESCSDMGSGGHAGSSSSTNLDQFTLTNSTATATLSQGAVSVPGVWAYTQPSTTYIRVGGEGDDSVGEALGVKGSCAPAAEGTPAASSLQVWKEQCPDGAAVTGCNNAWSAPWSGQVINACHSLASPNDKWRRVWGNYLSSGKSFYVYASSACGSTRQLVTNASKLVTPWDIHGWARAA